MKFKKTYSYALWSAIYLTLISVAITVISYYVISEHLGLGAIVIATIILFIISFFIIQYRAEHFIYRRLKKLYKDVSILNEEDLNKDSITTDIENLSEQMQQYVDGKRIEIKNLTEINSFRRDFLGNVAHELKTPLFTVQGYILTLLEGAVNDKEIRTKYLDRANKGVERLVAVIKDLDMIAKLETEGTKINYEVFNILELIAPLTVLRGLDRVSSAFFNISQLSFDIINSPRTANLSCFFILGNPLIYLCKCDMS